MDGRVGSDSITEAAVGSVRPPLPFRVKAGYGLGEAANGTFQVATDAFLLFYLTAVLGLSGTLAGTALLIGLLVDSVADPLIGYASDRTQSRWGRRHPWIVGGLVPLAATLGVIYSLPHMPDQTVLFVTATVILIVLRISTSVYGLPYIALGAELSAD